MTIVARPSTDCLLVCATATSQLSTLALDLSMVRTYLPGCNLMPQILIEDSSAPKGGRVGKNSYVPFGTWALPKLCLLLIFLVSGCAFISPRAACPGGTIFCNPLRDTNPEPLDAGSPTMQQALDYASGTDDQLSLLETQVDVATNITNFAILGAAVGTAAAAAFHAGEDVIVGLGFGTSGLLGFQYVSGIAAKRKALDQGISAIACVKRNAIAMNNLSTDALGSSSPPPPGAAGSPAAAAFANFSEALTSSQTTLELATHSRADLPPPALVPPGAAAPPPPVPCTPPPGGAPAVAATPATALAQRVQSSLLTDVTQAKQDADSAKATLNGAVQAATMNAPQTLVARVTMIKEAVFAAMHSAEPTGQQVSDQAQTLLKSAQNAANTNKTKQQNNSSKTSTAIAVAPTSCVQNAAPAVQQANSDQEQDASKASTIVDAVTTEATDCKSLIDGIGKGQ